MALSAEQTGSIKLMMDQFIEEQRPPEETRLKLDLGWRMEQQSVFIFEIRPDWQDNSITRHHDVAKATWVNTQKHWNIFWLRSNNQWTSYPPLPNVGNLQRFLIEVEKDPSHCFFG